VNIENSTAFKVLPEIYVFYDYIILLHDQNQLPSFGMTETVSQHFEYTKTKIIRLPYPFSTNCFSYKNSDHVKSQGQCINSCLMKKFIGNYKCVPKGLGYLTFSNIDLLNTKFCENSSFERSLKSECSKDCHLSCEESFFSAIDSFETPLMPSDEKYITYELMAITQFLTAIRGLLGLWNNLSVYDLQLFIIDFWNKFIDSTLVNRFSIYVFSLKWFRLSRVVTKVFLNFLVEKINMKVRISKF